MFTAGLSLDLNQFAKRKSQSIVFGSVSFLLPGLLAFFSFADHRGLTIPEAGAPRRLDRRLAHAPGLSDRPAAGHHQERGRHHDGGGTMVTDVVSLTILAVVVAAHKVRSMQASGSASSACPPHM
jgi:hypothetical protein